MRQDANLVYLPSRQIVRFDPSHFGQTLRVFTQQKRVDLHGACSGTDIQAITWQGISWTKRNLGDDEATHHVDELL